MALYNNDKRNNKSKADSIKGFFAVLIILPLLSGCKKPTTGRGFSEPSRFAGMLKPNPKTALAVDRTEPALSIIALHPSPFEITRNSEKNLPLKLMGQPLFARLQADVWHQGTDIKPRVSINGVETGTLEPCWPSLAQRNYVFFLWDKIDGKTINYQVDYQGWLKANIFFDGNLLKPGKNTVTLAVKLDQIKVKDVKIELLYKLDSNDTIYDFRKKTKHLPLPK
ncbi:MAG: hypothetical protein ABIJ15_07345 [bacterium]